jgi:diamine N-acetyltransferase
MKVELREITRANWRQVIRLKVAKEQEHFIASNAFSLAESKYEPECVPLAIYDSETMVGFLMYAFDLDDKNYWIYRLMLDAKQQGKGYGRAAMLEAIQLLKEKPDCTQIAISYEPDNLVAEKLYLSLGFEKTGEIIEGEAVARLKL